MADDLRSQYEELVKRREDKRQKVLEIKANQTALAERDKEIDAEILALGCDPTQLETVIANEEQYIKNAMIKLSDALKDVDQPQPKSVEVNASQPMNVDDVLAQGGQ